ncbi:MAG: pyridoxamine 5'-phosphate oxidase family protein, partial [Thermaurantiacus sp.]
MFVTRGSLGPHARPMSVIVRPDESRLWFLTDRETAKACEVERHQTVGVTFSNGTNRHVAITGRAEIVEERAFVRDLWTTSAQAFFPGGPDDESIVAIRVDPDVGELWDGPSTPVAIVKMAAALVTRTPADGMGDNVKVRMGGEGA